MLNTFVKSFNFCSRYASISLLSTAALLSAASLEAQKNKLTFQATSEYFDGPAAIRISQKSKILRKNMVIRADRKKQQWNTVKLYVDPNSSVRVNFLNDKWIKGKGDRNLILKNVRLNGKLLPSQNIRIKACPSYAKKIKGQYFVCNGDLQILQAAQTIVNEKPTTPTPKKPVEKPATPKPKPPAPEKPKIPEKPVVKNPIPEQPVTPPVAPVPNGKVTAEHCVTFMHKFGYGPKPGDVAKYCTNNPAKGMATWYNDARKPAAIQYNPGALDTKRYLKGFYERADKKDSSQFPFAGAQGSIETVNRIISNTVSPAQVTERLNSFWSNHFSVYMQKASLMKGLAPQMEKDAIRPHIYGKFEDMLIAVVKHPAMIIYLDNNISVGPNSEFGKKKKDGLNENLAREILELHTLGVNGGYTQNDVVELAKVLTGWSYNRNGFLFVKEKHEPGVKTVLGKKFFVNTPNTNEALVKEGEAVLRHIANHKSTARFVSQKLIRHFLNDEEFKVPAETSVNKLAGLYLQQKTNLRSLYDTMVTAAMKNVDAYPKYKAPYDMLIGLMRMHKNNNAKNLVSKKLFLERKARSLSDYGLWNWKAPDGWPDNARYWKTSTNILRAAEWCPGFITSLYGNEAKPAQTWKATHGSAYAGYANMMASNTFGDKEKLGLTCLSQLQLNR